MADSRILPGARARLVDGNGLCTAEFYRFFQRVAPTDAVNEVQTQIIEIQQSITDGTAFLPANTRLEATDGIGSTGILATGFMAIFLEDVEQEPGGTLQTVTIDGKGRVIESDAADTDDLPEGATNLYFTGDRVFSALAPGDGIGLILAGGLTTISLVGLPIFLVSQTDDPLTDQAGNLLISNQSTGLPVDWANITSKPTTLAGYGITDAQKIGAPVAFPPYTLTSVLAGTPSASANQYKAIYVTGLTGGDEPCVSDGTNWRRFSDHTIAS